MRGLCAGTWRGTAVRTSDGVAALRHGAIGCIDFSDCRPWLGGGRRVCLLAAGAARGRARSGESDSPLITDAENVRLIAVNIPSHNAAVGSNLPIELEWRQSVWSDRHRCADRGLGCEFRRTQFRATSGREPVMKEKLRFLGLDVHAETIAVAVAETDGEVRSLGTIPNRAESIRKMIKKLGPAEKLRACYEAGPTGYVVYWQLAELGIQCEVVAPTLVPVKAGDRVKTDRQDAEKLARCYRSGDLTMEALEKELAKTGIRGNCTDEDIAKIVSRLSKRQATLII